jgi:MoxR-like ATPase
MKDWWVYNGKETSKCEITLNNLKTIKPEWRKVGSDITAENFEILDNEELMDAVNAAIYLRRPLLVTGEPGIGKSTLAKSIAKELTKSKKPLHWQITSKSTVQDALYSYDAMSRLQDIQMKKNYYDLKQTEEANKIDTKIGNYIKLGVIGEAFLSKEYKVVLIDEIDKSDIDLPNDLLHIFEEQEFVIDEIKRVKEDKVKVDGYDIPGNGLVQCQGDFPIIIMTSNGEKDFPPAFLRRCISVEIKLPNNKEKQIEMLKKIVVSHFEKAENNADVDELIKKFVDLKIGNENRLLSNDQLLNAVFVLLSGEQDKETIAKTLFKTLG